MARVFRRLCFTSVFVVMCSSTLLSFHTDRSSSSMLKRETKMNSKADFRTVALLCYGLPRSLRFTIHSIRSNVISPLQNVDVQVDTFVHTFRHRHPISNRRSQELNVKLDNDEWKLLQPTNVSIEEVESVLHDQRGLLNKLKRYGDAWRDGFSSLERYLLGLHSAQYVTRMAEQQHKSYDGAILIRGDLLFYDPLDVRLFAQALRMNTIVIPAWQSWFGLNDRFMYGAFNEILRYGGRVEHVMSFCSQTGQPFHSEKFLYWISVNSELAFVKQKLLLCTKQRAARVRADGRIHDENFTPNTPMCQG